MIYLFSVDVWVLVKGCGIDGVNSDSVMNISILYSHMRRIHR